MCSGGIERTISLLSELYVKNGDYVMIITLDDQDSFYPLLSGVCHVRFGLLSDSKTKAQAIQNNLMRISKLRSTLKKKQIDVLITFSANTMLIGYIAKVGSRCRLVGAERANPFLSADTFWSRNKKRIAKLCDGFIFQTRGAAEYYSESIKKKGCIIPNGINSYAFLEHDRAWKDRADLCAVGRLDAEKRFDDLLRATAIVLGTHPSIKLDIFGDGPDRTDLEVLASELGLDDSVTFHGQCSCILAEYAAHKIFIMTSLQEGFPNVLLEAMASGCACISSSCDFGPSELIVDGINGFLVPVRDYRLIAEKICTLLEDDELAKSLSIEAKKIRKTHDINSAGMILHSFIEDLVRN
jgi:GalNAc-alpha-(1->4)-GalNAc-alpha-(1->3)-diNAcBac-PP-undecaprenol alpha-1,4-N-acetyl-D-galactosaminyltransferase